MARSSAAWSWGRPTMASAVTTRAVTSLVGGSSNAP